MPNEAAPPVAATGYVAGEVSSPVNLCGRRAKGDTLESLQRGASSFEGMDGCLPRDDQPDPALFCSLIYEIQMKKREWGSKMEQEMGFCVKQIDFCGFLAAEALDCMLNEDEGRGSVGRRETAAGGGDCFFGKQLHPYFADVARQVCPVKKERVK